MKDKFWIDKIDLEMMARITRDYTFREQNKLPLHEYGVVILNAWNVLGEKYGFVGMTAREHSYGIILAEPICQTNHIYIK